jgi:hypothetical protein
MDEIRIGRKELVSYILENFDHQDRCGFSANDIAKRTIYSLNHIGLEYFADHISACIEIMRNEKNVEYIKSFGIVPKGSTVFLLGYSSVGTVIDVPDIYDPDYLVKIHDGPFADQEVTIEPEQICKIEKAEIPQKEKP